MTNKRDYTMAKKGAVPGLSFLLVLVIIGIALAVYFRTKKSETPKTLVKPEFTFDANAKKTINPEESIGSQEGYRIIEYAESDLAMSKLIDLTLSWTNGQGYDSVNKIIFTRSVGDNEIQDKIEITKEDFPDMLKDYGNGSVTFKGSDVKKSAKGTNTIKAYWNEVNKDNFLAEAELKIDEDDFSYTANGPFGEYEVEITIVSGTFKLDKIVKKIYYNLSFLPEMWYKLQNNSDGTYSFKTIDNASKLKLGDQETFKMKTYKGKKILIHPNDDKKILVVSLGDKKFKSESDMSRQDWSRASFTLTAAATITPGITDYEDIKKGSDVSKSLYKSPNGVYRLEFEERGNLVVRKNDNEYIWESYTGDNQAKRIVVRPIYNNETNGELLFSKTDDFADGNLVKSYGSISNNFTKPYTLILGDDGILTIIDKTGKHTEALDFIATQGKVKPGDSFKCGSEEKAYRYIGHNQKNHYATPGDADRMDGQWGSLITVDKKWCKNTRDGPVINGTLVADFPELVFDKDLTFGFDSLCFGDSNKINTLKTKCKEHATCGGVGQQDNSCWHAWKGKGYRWPDYVTTTGKYPGGMFNFGLEKTSDSHLFRM